MSFAKHYNMLRDGDCTKALQDTLTANLSMYTYPTRIYDIKVIGDRFKTFPYLEKTLSLPCFIFFFKFTEVDDNRFA